MRLQCVGEVPVDALEEHRLPEDNTPPVVNKRLRVHGICVDLCVVVGAYYGGCRHVGEVLEDMIVDL